MCLVRRVTTAVDLLWPRILVGVKEEVAKDTCA